MTIRSNTSQSAASAALVVALLAAVCAISAPASVAAQPAPQEVERLMSTWRMDEAKEALDALVASSPDSAQALFLRGRYAFLQGEYARATQLVDQAINVGGANPYWEQTREIIASTGEVTKDYEAHTSPDGRFVLYVEPGGRDRVLLPYAFEALDRAYVELGKELGHTPETPIRVEVYPSTATLAKVSSLTEDEIRTSGTIALCKYNRLMITSPKALMRGYEWVDTLVHEYVHYVINHKTQNRVPIWMHEGMAKYLERRWRGPDAQRLSPSSEHMLRQRLDKDELITFEQMHPSMAKLPSQEDTAVAFAEVYTVMEYLRAEVGEGAFAKVLEGINEGLDAPEAFARVLGVTFPEFEVTWRSYLKTRPKVEYPDGEGFHDKLRFKDTVKDEQVTELKEIPKPAARDHVHLGEMLQARKRYAAAEAQYRKAILLMGDAHPVVQTRLAQSLLALNKPAKALDALRPIRDLYPSYVVTWIQLGKASLELEKYEDAERYLLEAARINPFDPQVHRLLAKTYDKLGKPGKAQRERSFTKLVM